MATAAFDFFGLRLRNSFLIMAITVQRPKLNWSEKVYLPAILSGMAITFRHLKNMLLGRTKVTMQYPEEKWDSHMPDHYRGAPALVKDETGSRPLCRLPALRVHLPAARHQDRAGRNSRQATGLPKSKNIPRNSIST